MPRARGSYPHPVLDHTDDVIAEFAGRNIVQESAVDHIELRFDLLWSENHLRQLVEECKAILFARWKCPRTLRLQSAQLALLADYGNSRRYGFAIPQVEVAGEIEIDVVIAAITSIDNYTLDTFNEDYGGIGFDIQPGDILATYGPLRIHADKLWDPMQPPLESCFKFVRDDGATSDVSVDLLSDPDQVIVNMSPRVYQSFAMMTGNPDVQIATVVLPALITALQKIQDDSDDADAYRSTSWGRALGELITRYGVSNLDPLNQAQKILENPISKSLTKLEIGFEE